MNWSQHCFACGQDQSDEPLANQSPITACISRAAGVQDNCSGAIIFFFLLLTKPIGNFVRETPYKFPSSSSFSCYYSAFTFFLSFSLSHFSLRLSPPSIHQPNPFSSFFVLFILIQRDEVELRRRAPLLSNFTFILDIHN